MAGYYEFVIGLRDNFSAGFGRLGQGMTNTINNAGTFAFKFNEINNSLGQFGQQFSSIIQPGIEYEKQMKEVEAITGVSGKKLEELGMNAKRLAEEFGGTAADGLNSYQIILSKLGPSLAQSSTAMDAMGRNVAMMANTMKGDTIGATTALTTAMNSYGISTKDPIEASRVMSKMMDMITAGAMAGSAEVPQITAAMEALGASASSAGVGFGEAQAAIQVLDQYGMKKGAEGGIALRNVLMQMGEGRFMPKQKLDAILKAGVNLQVLGNNSLPLATRLQELSKIQNDGALVGEFFGKENKVAGEAILRNIPILKEYTTKIIGGADATKKYSDVIGSSFAARMSRVGAVMSNFGIAIFESTKAYLPMIQTTGTLLFGFSQMLPAMMMMGNALIWVGAQVWTATLATLQYAGSLIYTAAQGVGTFILSLFKASTWQAVFTVSTYRSIAAMVANRAIMLGTSVGSTLYAAGLWVMNTAQWAVSVSAWAMLSPFLAIGAGFLAIGLAVYAIYKNWDTLKAYIYGFGQWLWKVGEFYLTYGNPLWWLYKGISSVVTYLFPQAGSQAMGFFSWIGGVLWQVGYQFMTTLNPMYWLGIGISKVFMYMFPSIGKDFTWFFNGIGKFLQDWGKWLYETVKWIWDGIAGFFSSIGKALGMVGDGVDKTMAKVGKLGEGKNLAESLGVGDLNKGLGTTQDALKGLGGDMGKLGTGSPTDIFSGNKAGEMGGAGTNLAGGGANKGLEGVSGGGSKPTNINITIGKLNETIQITTQNLKEGASDVEAILMQMLMRVVNGANQTGQ